MSWWRWFKYLWLLHIMNVNWSKVKTVFYIIRWIWETPMWHKARVMTVNSRNVHVFVPPVSIVDEKLPKCKQVDWQQKTQCNVLLGKGAWARVISGKNQITTKRVNSIGIFSGDLVWQHWIRNYTKRKKEEGTKQSIPLNLLWNKEEFSYCVG